jgi:hypothetical protein
MDLQTICVPEVGYTTLPPEPGVLVVEGTACGIVGGTSEGGDAMLPPEPGVLVVPGIAWGTVGGAAVLKPDRGASCGPFDLVGPGGVGMNPWT